MWPVREIAGAWLMTAGLVAIAAGASFASPLPVEIRTSPSVPVDWHPWFRSSFLFRDFAVDRINDRVLLAMSAPAGPSNLLVLDMGGTVVANTSLDVRPGLAPLLTVDELSGTVYVTNLGTLVLKIDTATGEVVDRWSIPFDVERATVHGGRIYASAAARPIQILDATTGIVLGNFSSSPAGPYTDLIVDPSGTWLLGIAASLGWSVVRIEIATGRTMSLPGRSGTFANSEDGRVFVCGSLTSVESTLQSFWPGNASLTDHRVPCRGRIDQNPSTGALMDSEGRLLRPDGGVGRSFVRGVNQVLTPLAYTDFGWRGDGHALVAVRVGGGFQVGTWDGTPHVAYQPTVRRLYSTDLSNLCFFVVSVSGMNESSLHGWVDDEATPLPLDVSDSFDCIDVGGLEDGPHVLRVRGWDLLAQPLDESFEFETDVTPPRIKLGSSLSPADASYELWGWANDSHLESVAVNGQPAVVSANRWSFATALPIGRTTFQVLAVDAIGQSATASYTVNYWPPYDRFVANASGRFSVPVAPQWIDVPATLPGEDAGVTLLGPIESSARMSVRVVSRLDPRATSDPGYAVDRVQGFESFVRLTRGEILEPARAVSVAGHPAATLAARVPTEGGVHRFVWTVVVAPEWERTITVTAFVPEAAWSSHENDLTWILEGFQIEKSPEAPAPTGRPAPILWSILLIGAGAGAGVLAIVLLRRRGKGPRPAKPGGAPRASAHLPSIAWERARKGDSPPGNDPRGPP